MTIRVKRYIPICLTLARIALTPVLLYLLIHNDLSQAFVVFIIIILTDIFDGMTARMLGACTRFGAIMDVIADLLYIVSSLAVLNIMYMAPVWLTLLVLFKFAEFYGTSYILRKGSTELIFVSDLPGRICAALFYMIPGIICLLHQVAFVGSGIVLTILLILIIFTALASTFIRCLKCIRIKRRQLL